MLRRSVTGKTCPDKQKQERINASQAAAKSRVAGPGWGWVCNEVCDGYVTRSVMRQSKAQYAKRASAAPAVQRKPSCGKKQGRWPGLGLGLQQGMCRLCNEVCSKAQYAKRLRSSSLIAAIQRKPGCGKKRTVTSLARFVHLRCVSRVCDEGVYRGVCNEGCVTSQLVLLQRSVTNVRRGSATDPSKKITAICAPYYCARKPRRTRRVAFCFHGSAGAKQRGR